MRSFVIKWLLAVTLVIHSQHMVNGELLVDYQLNGDEYAGVAYEDMFDMLNSTLELSYEEVKL